MSERKKMSFKRFKKKYNAAYRSDHNLIDADGFRVILYEDPVLEVDLKKPLMFDFDEIRDDVLATFGSSQEEEI